LVQNLKIARDLGKLDAPDDALSTSTRSATWPVAADAAGRRCQRARPRFIATDDYPAIAASPETSSSCPRA
jgi:hypothetical protein